MSLRVKIAETPEELDACFRLRYLVYAEQEHFVPVDDHQTHLVDRFDGCGTATTLAAFDDGNLVGTVRLIFDSAIGIDTEDYCDFRQYLVNSEDFLASAGRLCIPREVRGQVQTIRALMLMVYWLCVTKGVTHLSGAINTRLVSTLGRVGFKQTADSFTVSDYNVELTPCMLTISEASDPLLDFVKQLGIVEYIRSFTHEFFRDGEIVTAARDMDALACFIVQGSVRITSEENDEPIRELGVGELFCTDQVLVRVGGKIVVTAIGSLELTVMTRSAFNEQMRDDPQKAMRFLDLLGERMMQLLKGTE